MKVLYVHRYRKVLTGAHYMNRLMIDMVRAKGVGVKNTYPSENFESANPPLGSLGEIPFKYPILKNPSNVKHFDAIQAPTYLILPFTKFSTPTISHFGSTARGYIEAFKRTPLEKDTKKAWLKLKKYGLIKRLDFIPDREIKDISRMENLAAKNSSAVIAASKVIAKDLIEMGADAHKVIVAYNVIADFWFSRPRKTIKTAKLITICRTGEDRLRWSIKGIDRLITIYENVSGIDKISILKTSNGKLASAIKDIPNNTVYFNLAPHEIKRKINPLSGSIFLLTSRYEGFSLTLIEAMSQGLIPVVFSVGVAPEIIINGENGFLVDNTQEAIEKIRLLSSDYNLRNTLSKNSRITSLQFKSETLADKLITLYKKLNEHEVKNKPLSFPKIFLNNGQRMVTANA